MKEPWTCERCGRGIAADEGFVALLDRDPATGVVGGYPQGPTEESESWPHTGPGDLPAAVEAWKREAERPSHRIAFVALHDACSLHAERSGATVRVEDVWTFAA